MQHEKKQLIRQQEIMRGMGFYYGVIDGIWGPKSIEAKKRYESDATFTPGIPNNGMPFGSRPPYPRGVTVGAGSLLHHMVLDKPVVAEIVVPEEAPVSQTEAPSSATATMKKK